MKEEMKAIQSEIKRNIRGTISEGKENRTENTGLNQKEEINLQPEQNEETRIQKKKKERDRLWNLWDNFECSNI